MNKNKINYDLIKKQIEEGFTIPQLMEYWKCSRTKITSFKKDNGLVGLSPNSKKRDNGDGTKTCNICNISKPLKDFYSNGFTSSGKKKIKPSCKICENEKRYVEYIEWITEYLVSKDRKLECELCGYNKNYAALCFHHTGTKTLNFARESKTSRKLTTLNEIDNCQILCHNCHMEVHHKHLGLK